MEWSTKKLHSKFQLGVWQKWILKQKTLNEQMEGRINITVTIIHPIERQAYKKNRSADTLSYDQSQTEIKKLVWWISKYVYIKIWWHWTPLTEVCKCNFKLSMWITAGLYSSRVHRNKNQKHVQLLNHTCT